MGMTSENSQRMSLENLILRTYLHTPRYFNSIDWNNKSTYWKWGPLVLYTIDIEADSTHIQCLRDVAKQTNQSQRDKSAVELPPTLDELGDKEKTNSCADVFGLAIESC